MTKQKNKDTSPKKPENKATEASFSFGEKDSHLWVLTALAFFGFAYYSTKSVGYYQDDEIAHFMSMLGFWKEPTSIMGNWAKPGYKLLYALPALLGFKTVLYLNCLVSALGCFLAAKVAQHFDKRAAVFALILAATQPMWIELSFRNYADILSGVLLIASVYFALKEKWLVSSLFLSYDILVRQEFLILLLVYGAYLLVHRKWLAMFALGVFPLLFALWTLSVHGDFWYMITEAKRTAGLYAGQYPKQGLWHYTKMLAVLFGALQLSPLILFIYTTVKAPFVGKNIILKSSEKTLFDYLGGFGRTLATFFKRFPNDLYFVFIPFLVFFTIHSLFNMKSPEIGTATGGNLRYMTAVSPLVGVMAALGFLHIKRPSKTEMYFLFGSFAIVVFAWMCYEHQYLSFKVDPKSVRGATTLEEYESMKDYIKDYFPIVFYLVGVLLVFFQPKELILMVTIIVSNLIYISREVHPYTKLTPENLVVKNLIKSIAKQKDLKDKPIYSNHTNVWYYWYLETGSLKDKTGSLDSTQIENAPKGTLLLWDTHYGFRSDRPGSVDIRTYFNNDTFMLRNKQASSDGRFEMFVIEKVK